LRRKPDPAAIAGIAFRSLRLFGNTIAGGPVQKDGKALEYDIAPQRRPHPQGNMAEILILESEERYRILLRFILEGIGHRVLEAPDRDHVPAWPEGGSPDLVVMGVHLDLDGEGTMSDWPIWQGGLPEAPVLVLFSGNPHLKDRFLKSWNRGQGIRCLEQPVQPHAFLAAAKEMLGSPRIGSRADRRQHAR
jgi:CheY-like chemotaxis protein